MSTETKALTVATPVQMVEVWNIATGTSRDYARREVKDNPIPPGLQDPTFHRTSNPTNRGWYTASGITNPSAIRDMRAALQRAGLRAPDSTEAAWKLTLRRLDGRAEVRQAVDKALSEAWEANAVTADDFATFVLEAVSKVGQPCKDDRWWEDR